MFNKRSFLLPVLIVLFAILLSPEVHAGRDSSLPHRKNRQAPASVEMEQWKGRIVDGNTGEPIPGAVIVRSWTANFKALEFLEPVFMDLEEAVSGDDGKFIFPKRSSIVQLPFRSVKENKPFI